jgi:hypothetical protein
MDEGLGFGSLIDLWGKIKIEVYFSRGKGGPWMS